MISFLITCVALAVILPLMLMIGQFVITAAIALVCAIVGMVSWLVTPEREAE